jgi:hypothetical protein
MATKRRGGLRPPQLRGTLGTLLRTTTGVVRDAIERGAREGRARLDDALSGRRRDAILADLGEIVLDLVRRGEIDLAELPEARDLIRQLDDLDAEPTDPEPAPLRATTRHRFDDRPGRDPAASDDGTVSSGAVRSSRPTIPTRPKSAESQSSRAPTRPIKGLWRPDVEAAGPPDAPPGRRSPLPHDPHSKGGISFEGDDDLEDYMHPDDVPPRTSPSDPDDSAT